MSPVKYLKEVGHQLKKVKWPSFSTFMNTFGVVLIIIVIASLILYFETWTGVQLMNSLRDAFKNIATSTTTSA